MVMEGNFQQLLECPVDSFSFHIDLVLSGIQILHLSILQPDKKNHNTEQSQQKNVSTGYFQLKYRKKRLHTVIIPYIFAVFILFEFIYK